MRQPDGQRVVQQVDVDQRHVRDGEVLRYDEGLHRDHEGGEDAAEDDVAEGRPEFGQGVGRGRAEDDLQYPGAGRLDDRVPQVGRQPHQVPGVGVAARPPLLGNEGGRGAHHFLGRLHRARDHPVDGEEEREREEQDDEGEHRPVGGLAASSGECQRRDDGTCRPLGRDVAGLPGADGGRFLCRGRSCPGHGGRRSSQSVRVSRRYRAEKALSTSRSITLRAEAPPKSL